VEVSRILLVSMEKTLDEEKKEDETMPRITKADLMNELAHSNKEVYRLQREVSLLEKEVKFLRSPHVRLDSMTVALERICDATAHVLTDLKTLELRRR